MCLWINHSEFKKNTKIISTEKKYIFSISVQKNEQKYPTTKTTNIQNQFKKFDIFFSIFKLYYFLDRFCFKRTFI
jgi:hypothetical protein